MIKFEYKAIDSQGNVSQGSVEAVNQEKARMLVFEMGLDIVDMKEAREQSGSVHAGRVSKADVENFTRELANLLTAGVPLSKALNILVRETAKPACKKNWSMLSDFVSAGMSLADSMRKLPRVFSPVHVAMVQAGETGGFLDLVLAQIAEFRSREQDLMGRVKAAMFYPLTLAVLCASILVFLLIYFVPRFSRIFESFGGKLPALTQYIVSLSSMVIDYWMLIVGVIVILVLAVRNYLNRDEGRLTLERLTLKTPLIGKLVARFAFVRFSRMLGTLSGSGVPLVATLIVAKESIGNRVLSNRVDGTIKKVKGGMTLAASLADCKEFFPGSVIEMIAVAEETGRLDKELVRVSEAYEKELDRQLKMAVSMAEPLMLFIMAVVVGTVVVGMLLPIFSLQELIK
ncbi:MAG: type II secretion system F family protein [Sedimentisphaerales bacterium]|nr:type II secretion system F family protein [Sedimentisphaerales bacterium]MBN2843517.1 type II secretion system F family protein [Sedimentisphaerales bacterium]